MTLTELVTFLKKEYPQTTVEAKTFNFREMEYTMRLQPKYFFRGEKQLYKNTHSKFCRMNIESKFNRSELLELCFIHHHLYLFLKEARFNYGTPDAELSIAGLLQHYGFDTVFLDVTSDISIAANFASRNNIGEKGKILVIKSKTLNEENVNYYFDLTTCPGKRPIAQSSYVIWDQQRSLDLKNKGFLSKHDAKWFEFTLGAEDKSNFYDQSILSVTDDTIVNEINEWWELSDIQRSMKEPRIIAYIKQKIEVLNP
jgi:hypothetical protein